MAADFVFEALDQIRMADVVDQKRVPVVPAPQMGRQANAPSVNRLLMRAACANTTCPGSNDLSNADFDCVIDGSAGGGGTAQIRFVLIN